MRSTQPLALAALLASAACNGSTTDEALSVGRDRSVPDLRTFENCEGLLEGLRANLRDELMVSLLHSGPVAGIGGDATTGGGPDAPNAGSEGDAAGGAGGPGEDFSGTNNQEAGVDEADFVKSDGAFLYLLDGNRLEILGTPTPGSVAPVSTTPLEGRPNALLLDGDRLVVIAHVSPWEVPGDHPLHDWVGDGPGRIAEDIAYRGALTAVCVFDVSDRAIPALVRRFYVEGTYLAAREANGAARIVTHFQSIPRDFLWHPDLPQEYYSLSYDDPRARTILDQAVRVAMVENDARLDQTTLEDFVPRVFERFGDQIVDVGPTASDAAARACDRFSMAEDGTGRGVSSILSFDLANVEQALGAVHVVSNPSVVYASQDTLVLSEPANDRWWYFADSEYEEATNLHRFDLTSPTDAVYTGSGRVKGTVPDQFGLSEKDGVLRVASTSGLMWFASGMESQVTTLGGEGRLEILGHVGGIAPGERLWASRFLDDRGFLITFRNIDPLWTIDLSDPANPFIVGELEIEGVSTYLHPIEGDHLLAVGRGGNAAGLDGSVQVSLFDVTDFGAPALADELTLLPPGTGDGWFHGTSEALHEHKAFQYWAPAKLLAVPLSAHRFGGGSPWGEVRSTLELIRVDIASGFSVHGSIDHSEFFAGVENDHFYGSFDVRRSMFFGEHVYAISNRAVSAHRIDDLVMTAHVAFAGGPDAPHWDD